MILNFFLDNRIGGPHIYSEQLTKFRKIKSINVTCGNSKLNSIKITNLRNKWKYLYFVEIIINLFEIILLFKYKKFSTLNILNLIPDKDSLFETVLITTNDVLVEMFLNKKIEFNQISFYLIKIIKFKLFKKYYKMTPKSIEQIMNVKKLTKKYIKKYFNNKF